MSKWVDGKKTRGRRAKVAGTRVIADGRFRPSGNIGDLSDKSIFDCNAMSRVVTRLTLQMCHNALA